MDNITSTSREFKHLIIHKLAVTHIQYSFTLYFGQESAKLKNQHEQLPGELNFRSFPTAPPSDGEPRAGLWELGGIPRGQS